jgi:hypothetical protein
MLNRGRKDNIWPISFFYKISLLVILVGKLFKLSIKNIK